MITPSQIKEKVLSTASHGYDIDETNEFLQQIEESFSAIYDENKELYRKMEILAAKIEEYRAEEDSIKDTLLTAQKAASKVEKEAQEKSEKLLADSANTVQNTVMEAKAKAEKIISEAREYAADITKEKTEAAEAILSEAREKADKELADAKADAAGLLTEAKNISQELLTKSKEEKDYYESLTNNLKKEADAFKERLVSLYETQLQKLGDMMEAPVSADDAEISDKIDETQQNIENVSAKIDEIEQDIAENEAQEIQDEQAEETSETEADEDTAEDNSNAPEEQDDVAFTQDEEEDTQDSADDDFDVEYELEEISKSDAQEEDEEPDVKEAIDAFSQDPADDGEVTEINEEPEMEQQENDEEEDGQHLPFEDFFHVKPEGVRTSEKISLIPPDEEDDEDGGVKFKGFFKKKRK